MVALAASSLFYSVHYEANPPARPSSRSPGVVQAHLRSCIDNDVKVFTDIKALNGRGIWTGAILSGAAC